MDLAVIQTRRSGSLLASSSRSPITWRIQPVKWRLREHGWSALTRIKGLRLPEKFVGMLVSRFLQRTVYRNSKMLGYEEMAVCCLAEHDAARGLPQLRRGCGTLALPCLDFNRFNSGRADRQAGS